MAVGALHEVRIGPSDGAKTGVLDAAGVGGSVGVAIGCAAPVGLQGDSVTSQGAIPTNDAYASTTLNDCKAAAAISPSVPRSGIAVASAASRWAVASGTTAGAAALAAFVSGIGAAGLGVDDSAFGCIGSLGSLSNDMLRTETAAVHCTLAVSSRVSVVNRGTASDRTTDPVIALEPLTSDGVIEPSTVAVPLQTFGFNALEPE
jgi:hypothetical protein